MSIILPENFNELPLSEQQRILQTQIEKADTMETPSILRPMPRPENPQQGGLLSRLGGGLLGVASQVGGGLMDIGRGVGGVVAEPLAAGVRDFADINRLYQRAMMTQPIASYDPSDIKNISPMSIAASLPEFRAEEEQREAKLEQMRAISDYRKEAAKRNPDMEKLRDLAARAYPELAARQMFKAERPLTKAGVQGEVLAKVARGEKLSEGEQKIFDMMNKEDLVSLFLKGG